MIKIGINGFGRIGRFVFRASLEEATLKKCKLLLSTTFAP